MWKPLPGFFTPGTPLYTEEGGDILKGPRNLDDAKRLLADSGYAGQPVTCLAAQDVSFLKAWGDVAADLLRRLGMNVDFVATDWGNTFARAQQKSAGQGSWNMFFVWHPGVDCAIPGTNKAVRANGDQTFSGMAQQPGGRGAGRRLVRCRDVRGGKGRRAPAGQGCA